jgi:hypothetical protein
MTEDTMATCSLSSDALKQRLAAIAEIGSDSLISHDIEGGRHLLRFRANATTRQRLEGIVAAEAECCSSLALSLSEDDGALVLSIAAPRNAKALADGLAGAFAGVAL